MKLTLVFTSILLAITSLPTQANIIWDFRFSGGAGILESTGTPSQISNFNDPIGQLNFDVLNFQMTQPANQDFLLGDVWKVDGTVGLGV